VRHGEEVRLIAIDDVCYFKAEDKYTVVKTRDGESLIKKSIRQLTEELDPDQFWRIHRGTIINISQIVESLIKKSIRQLTEELDPDQFWRIHRGTIINISQIARVSRSFSGRLIISLKNLSETLTVSRSYAHLFKQM